MLMQASHAPGLLAYMQTRTGLSSLTQTCPPLLTAQAAQGRLQAAGLAAPLDTEVHAAGVLAALRQGAAAGMEQP